MSDRKSIIPDVFVSDTSQNDGFDLNNSIDVLQDEIKDEEHNQSKHESPCVSENNSDLKHNIEETENCSTENSDYEILKRCSAKSIAEEVEQCTLNEALRLSVQIVNDVVASAEHQLRKLLTEGDKLEVDIKKLELQLQEILDDQYPDDSRKRRNTKETSFTHCMNQQEMSENEDKQLNSANNFQTFGTFADSYKCKKFSNISGLNENNPETYGTDKLNSSEYISAFDSTSYEDPDIVCGIGCFKPKWLQSWATPKVYLVIHSLFAVLSGSYYPYLTACLSTLEKRFSFKTEKSAYLMMVDEIAPITLGILVGYLGSKWHRPRLLGFSLLMLSVSAFLSAAPYFIYDSATHLVNINLLHSNITEYELCGADYQHEQCASDSQPATTNAVIFLMIAGFLKGFGHLAFMAIGLPYLDDNSRKKDSPLYFATILTVRMLGPMCGFLMSTVCLKFYENPFVDPGFDPKDPRWIGAWWMGFLFQGVLELILVLPMMLFPRSLPGYKISSMESARSESHSGSAGMLNSLKRIFKTPVFILFTLNNVMAIFGHFGHIVMLPKYMENQFHLSASDASLYSGPPGIAAVMVATVLGGLLIWKFKPNVKFLTLGMATLEILGAASFLLLMIPNCKSLELSHSAVFNGELVLEESCNDNCGCSTGTYSPVCGSDGQSLYFSPCYAGCQESHSGTFYNCSCVMSSFGFNESFVSKNYCTFPDCWSQALIYIIAFPIFQSMMCLLNVANTMILLRSMLPEDKSTALGVFEMFVGAFGFLPFPIFFGVLVDSACLVWQENCGQNGNCWFYDVSKLRYLLHGSSALFSFLSSFFLFGIYCLSGRLQPLYEDDTEVRNNPKAGKSNRTTKTFLNTPAPDMYSSSL